MRTKTGNPNGSKWVRYSTRLVIYLRDGVACVWCARGIDHDAQLTLDHYVPRSAGGDNDPRNLVTACLECNVGRGDKTAAEWARELYELHAPEVLREVTRKRRRVLPRAQALELLRARGSVARVLERTPTAGAA